ncbi:MAG: hypothetical protein WBK10_08190 [Bacillota bacterium]|jgi:hypothetical protein|nr:hypothetical protein [Bacillota bacterium]
MRVVLAFGIGAMLCCAVACAALSARSFLTLPVWVPFLPVALAWFACGLRGMTPERLLGTAAISIVGAPILAAWIVSLPVPAEEEWAVAFSVIRHSMAVVIVVFLPLCLASMLAGAAVRGALEGGILRFPRR